VILLYICERCGRWQEASLGKAIVDAWNNAFNTLKVETVEKSGVPCPVGHGLMRMVTADDRLAAWTSNEWKEEFGDAPEPTNETKEAPGRLTIVECD
jgi:hypothetical protein